MSQAIHQNAMTTFEKMIVNINGPLMDAVIRFAIGMTTVWASARLFPRDELAWKFPVLLLVVLALLRIIPAVLRTVLPVPAAVKREWFNKRQLAKRYDSYQWQKLFWIGVGIAAYASLQGGFPSLGALLAAIVCLLAGYIGRIRWQNVSRDAKACPPVSTAKGVNRLTLKD